MYQVIANNIQNHRHCIVGSVSSLGRAKTAQVHLQAIRPAWVIWVRKVKKLSFRQKANVIISKGTAVAIRCAGFTHPSKRATLAATGTVASINGQLVKVTVSGSRLPHYFLTSQLCAI